MIVHNSYVCASRSYVIFSKPFLIIFLMKNVAFDFQLMLKTSKNLMRFSKVTNIGIWCLEHNKTNISLSFNVHFPCWQELDNLTEV